MEKRASLLFKWQRKKQQRKCR